MLGRWWPARVVRHALLFVCVGASAGAAAAAAEQIKIQTLTLEREPFLRGIADGKDVVISGELELPEGATGPVPAVLLMHGAGGVQDYHALWARELRAVGAATFIVDSFSGRGVGRIADQLEAVGLPSRVIDAYRALAVLAAHPKIDRERIVYLGFSHGATAALPASQRRFLSAFGPSDASFAGWLLFYAFCNTRLIGDDAVTARPIRLFHGIADDYTPISTCRQYVERVRAAGADVVLHEYAHALHGFDNPRLSQVSRNGRAMNPTRCYYEEKEGAVVVNAETGKPMSYRDACWTRGVTTGYQPEAHTASLGAVKAFLAGLVRR
jgi:dienelactone hydrolase